jgi:transcriptional regulator of acetoin/glycerol metabolism
MLSHTSSLQVDRQALIAQARSALLVNGVWPVRAGVDSWITRSWQRCLSRGLQPRQRVVFDGVSASALRSSQDQHGPLLRAARPVLDQLTRAIADMKYFTMLTDARGIVLEVLGPVDQGDRRASAIGRRGIDLSEAMVGTTAIGAALTELQPVWLHRGEHFFADNGSYSCAGAPLFDPQGQCIGMLDLTGVDVPERPELRHLVARSARAVEDALLLQEHHALLLRLNWPGCTLGGEGDGLLTLDTDGFVLGSNSMARQLLPRPLRPPGIRLHCSDLMALPWTLLFDAARSSGDRAPLDVPLWSGLRLHCMAGRAEARQHRGMGNLGTADAFIPLPAVASLHLTNAQSAVSAPLREAETALICQAVQKARGNVAEAARALGISRATVYRKLGASRSRRAGGKDA